MFKGLLSTAEADVPRAPRRRLPRRIRPSSADGAKSSSTTSPDLRRRTEANDSSPRRRPDAVRRQTPYGRHPRRLLGSGAAPVGKARDDIRTDLGEKRGGKRRPQICPPTAANTLDGAAIGITGLDFRVALDDHDLEVTGHSPEFATDLYEKNLIHRSTGVDHCHYDRFRGLSDLRRNDSNQMGKLPRRPVEDRSMLDRPANVVAELRAPVDRVEQSPSAEGSALAARFCASRVLLQQALKLAGQRRPLLLAECLLRLLDG